MMIKKVKKSRFYDSVLRYYTIKRAVEYPIKSMRVINSHPIELKKMKDYEYNNIINKLNITNEKKLVFSRDINDRISNFKQHVSYINKEAYKYCNVFEHLMYVKVENSDMSTNHFQIQRELWNIVNQQRKIHQQVNINIELRKYLEENPEFWMNINKVSDFVRKIKELNMYNVNEHFLQNGLPFKMVQLEVEVEGKVEGKLEGELYEEYKALTSHAVVLRYDYLNNKLQINTLTSQPFTYIDRLKIANKVLIPENGDESRIQYLLGMSRYFQVEKKLPGTAFVEKDDSENSLMRLTELSKLYMTCFNMAKYKHNINLDVLSDMMSSTEEDTVCKILQRGGDQGTVNKFTAQIVKKFYDGS